MKIKSKTETINNKSNVVFKLVSNCNNFGKVLPDKVSNWESTENSCSFEVSGLAKISINIVEKVENQKVVFSATANQPIKMKMICYIDDISANICNCFIEMDLDVPIFLTPMVKNPMENFVETLIEKIKIESEKTI